MSTDGRWWRVGILVVVLLLSGCSGVFPAEDGTERDPYAVDDEVNSSDERDDDDTEPEYLAPGLTADGVRDSDTLLEHHFAVLEAESGNGTYVAVENTTRWVNGTLLIDGHVRSVTQYPKRWHEISNTTTFEQNVTETTAHELWTEDGEQLFREISSNGSVEYRNQSLRTQPKHPRSPLRTLDMSTTAVYTQSSGVTVDEQLLNETRWYIVTMRNEQDEFTETYTLHIREDGFIEYTSREHVTKREDGSTERHKHTLTYEFHPETALGRPDWYDDALEATAADNE